MSDRFVDGQGAQYSPSLVRIGAGVTNAKIQSIGLKEQVDAVIAQGADLGKLEHIIGEQQGHLCICLGDPT